jgi:hypothetical protein
LFFDTFQVIYRQIFFRVLNGHGTFFDGVFEMPMVASGSDVVPTVGFQHRYHFA